MPLSDEKVTTIIIDECDKLEERATDYRRAIREAIADILMHERQNLVEAINIQQRVNQTCDSAADLFVGSNKSGTAKE